MDKNGDGKISLKEIEDEFEKHQISTASMHSKRIPLRSVSINMQNDEDDDE